MGNDGGSIPTRRELVKETARNPSAAEVKESQHEQQEYLWTTDPISLKPLARPVVSDSDGNLYNKETILELLVEGSRKADAERVTRGSVKTLKDVVEVKFENGADASDKAEAVDPSAQEVWKCPVTGDRLGPGSKAVYLVPCGHAFSGIAIKEVSGEMCLSCETEYASNDVIPILPRIDTDIARLTLRIKSLQERGLTHSLKKAVGGGKKRKKRDEAPEAVAITEAKAGVLKKTASPANKPVPIHGHTNLNGNGNGINNASTATLTAKVVEEQEQVKKRKLENENVRGLFSSRDQIRPIGKSSDFMTRGYSLPANAKR